MGEEVLDLNSVRNQLKEKNLKGWRVVGKKMPRLFKLYNMKDFLEAVSFLNSIKDVAEKMEHHPDICIVNYNQMKIFLLTHEVKGLTKLDIDLATEIENIYKSLKKTN